MSISEIFFDAELVSWKYYSAFFVRMIGYYGVKYLLVFYGLVLLGLLFYSFQSSYWQQKRLILVFLLLALLLIPVEIAVLKQTFYKPHPDQVADFGGYLAHVKLTEFVNDPNASNWPGGHASGGAALLSFYFVGQYLGANWRYRGLYLGLIVSQFMGLIQVMRGQHFFPITCGQFGLPGSLY